MALIRLHVCAGWSVPLLVANTTLLEILCCASNVKYMTPGKNVCLKNSFLISFEHPKHMSSIGPVLAPMTSRRQIQDGGPTTSDPRWRPQRSKVKDGGPRSQIQDGGPGDGFGYTSEDESTS